MTKNTKLYMGIKFVHVVVILSFTKQVLISNNIIVFVKDNIYCNKNLGCHASGCVKSVSLNVPLKLYLYKQVLVAYSSVHLSSFY